MTFIKMIEPEDADEKLQSAYNEIVAWRGGRLPPVLQTMSLHPEAMLAVKRLNETVTFGGSTLGRRREEMIATLVSAVNGCDY